MLERVREKSLSSSSSSELLTFGQERRKKDVFPCVFTEIWLDTFRKCSFGCLGTVRRRGGVEKQSRVEGEKCSEKPTNDSLAVVAGADPKNRSAEGKMPFKSCARTA